MMEGSLGNFVGPQTYIKYVEAFVAERLTP